MGLESKMLCNVVTGLLLAHSANYTILAFM